MGGVSVVPLELFDGIDYTALGHLHGRATLTETVRYSGSPLAYSFSEAGHLKGSWLVDLGADGSRGGHASSPPRSTAPSPGSRARSTSCSPTSGSRDTRQSWVQATLTDDVRPPQAMERLRARFPHTLTLRFAPEWRRTPPGTRGHDRPGARTTSRSTSSPTSAAGSGPPRPSPTCCARPSSAAPTTPTSSPRVTRWWRLMRLHDLSITAFGPFVDTVHVDFDDLAEGGLFLLTGDTGPARPACSTPSASVCTATSRVTGTPHVTCAATTPIRSPSQRCGSCSAWASARFRFTRSPAWDRPRQRSGGTRRIQAHVVAEELRDGDWSTLTNRLDEAGQLVTSLLGMTCAQFTQVAMLPQGRFQAFLRATSGERHAVLQRLFRTRRFEDVERWLVDRRIGLRRRSQTLHDRCAGVLHRFQEAAGVGVPEGGTRRT